MAKKAEPKKTVKKKTKTAVKKVKPTRKKVTVKKKSSAAKPKTKAPVKEEPPKEITHSLMPPHRKISQAEKKSIFDKYNVTEAEMPKIKISDPAIAYMALKEGDVIEIERNSPTAGKIKFYRCVTRE